MLRSFHDDSSGHERMELAVIGKLSQVREGLGEGGSGRERGDAHWPPSAVLVCEASSSEHTGPATSLQRGYLAWTG